MQLLQNEMNKMSLMMKSRNKIKTNPTEMQLTNRQTLQVTDLK